MTHTESWGATPATRWKKAVPTEAHGITFPSKAEAKRYSQLKLMERAKAISGLRCHPAYSLVINGEKVGRYTPDFEYIENGKLIVEEVKGYVARDYPFRRKAFRALYPHIEHREIRA